MTDVEMANGEAAPVNGNGHAKKAEPTAADKAAAEQCKAEGNASFKASNWDEAVASYTQAIEHDPTQPAYYTNRAAALMSMKKFRPALADCQQASQLQGDSSAKTLVRMARCHFSLGQVTQAQTILAKIVDADGRASSTSSSSGFTADEVASAKALQAQVKRLAGHLDQAASYRASKDWTLAGIAIGKAIADVSEEHAPLAWKVQRADLLLRKGQLDAANSAAADLLRSDQQNSEALVLRARVLLAKGELAKALAHAQAALRSDPDCKPARSIMKRAKKLEAAKTEGNNAFKSGATEDAIQKYSDALALADEDIDADGELRGFKATILSNRATANLKAGKHEAAVSDCDEALAQDSGYVKALRTRARAQLKLERYEEAVRDFKQALEEMSTGADDQQKDINALKQELRSAELDLKRSKQKDYYKILGVEKSASDAEIKKAYRKESLKHHPDKGGDSEKFKLCSEAYSILSDETKRRRYDMGADDPDAANPFGFGGMGGFDPYAFGGGMGGFGMGGHSHFGHGMGGHGNFGPAGGFGEGINVENLFGGASSFAGAGGPFGSAGGAGAGSRRPFSGF